MSEFGEQGFPQKEVSRQIDLQSTTDIVSSAEWNALNPNFPSEKALLPRDLQTDQVTALIAAVADEDILSATSWERAKIAFDEKEIPHVGKLEKIGGGEGKVCYALTTSDGKEMAVLIRGYAASLGSLVPEDPRMIKIKETTDASMWEYSDLRTYALFPATQTLAVQLQEFGGRNVTQDLGYASTRGDVDYARGKARAYVAAKGSRFTMDQQELSHPRHALFNQGEIRPPAIIDIPVIERKLHS